jgi:hypothetical protein
MSSAISDPIADMPDFAKEMLKTFQQNDIQELLSAVRGIAGYKLPQETERIFKNFHSYITNPEPDYITKLRQNPKTEYWYHRHVNGILGNTQSALACVLHHRDNLLGIEKAIFELDVIQKCKSIISEKSIIGIGHGNSLKLDFEYQACIIAMRRCLEYMTYGFCSYLKNEINDFRTLSKTLKPFVKKGDPVAIALTKSHQIWVSKFDSIITGQHGRSIRDKISHFEHVPAGVLNLSFRGLVLVGGGESLNINNESPLLSEVLNARVNDLESCISYFIKAFIEAEKI